MAEYEMAFILTDCEMKQVGDEIQIVKRSSLTPEMMNDFVPFNFAVIKGEEDDEGRIQLQHCDSKCEAACHSTAP